MFEKGQSTRPVLHGIDSLQNRAGAFDLEIFDYMQRKGLTL